MGDFLSTRGIRAIRREIKSITDSYHHYWDPVAELLQNARDAVMRSRASKPERRHFIRISVDPTQRVIEVLDNGVGIPKERVDELLGPGGGDKDVDGEEAGEKGVGLTYAIFTSNRFELESRYGNQHHGGSVAGGNSWLRGSSGGGDPPEYETADPPLRINDTEIELTGETYDLGTFTRVRLEQVPFTEDSDIFHFTPEQLKMLLRTRTALGVTDRLFAGTKTWQPPFDAILHLVDPSGDPSLLERLEVGFPPFHRFVEDGDTIELRDAGLRLAGKKLEKQKNRLLQQKTIWTTAESEGKSKETIRVYGAMFPGNQVFGQLAEELKLQAGDKRQDPDLLSSGIYVATKGMPTGVTIPAAQGVGQYPAYYKRCFFLVESDAISFDLGRKSMHWQPRERLQQAVAEVFKKFENLARYQTPGRVNTKRAADQRTKAQREAQAKKRWREYRNLVDLNMPGIAFAKEPSNQEAAVAAIFHEVLGAGLLEKYVPLHTGYGVQYDVHALYKMDDGTELELVIEFKYALENLLKDFASDKKKFDDLHLLVAWKADAQKLKNENFHLEVVSGDGSLEGVTHYLDIPVEGIDPVPVILLEELLKEIKKSR